MPKRRRPALALVLVAALLALAGAFAACGESSSDEETAGVVHRLLLAALAQDPESLESFPGDLPPDMPADVPVYPGGEVIVSAREIRPPDDAIEEPAAGDPVVALYFILIGTRDESADVFAYYSEALDEDPWQIEQTVATSELQRIDFSLIADPDVGGTLDIARGRGDEATTIIISIQDSGAEQIGDAEYELPESLPVPAQWPPEVPIYEGATITSSAFVREPGRESILVTFLTEDSQDDVVAFYRSTFTKLGWLVEDVATDDLSDRFSFGDRGDEINGDLRADRFGRDRDYTEVAISIQQQPGREPEGTPTEGEDILETPSG
jgi:hypothetical protein